jgi:cell division protein FtsN
MNKACVGYIATIALPLCKQTLKKQAHLPFSENQPLEIRDLHCKIDENSGYIVRTF